MKPTRVYLLLFILILNFSFLLQGNNIISSEQENKDKRNVYLPLTSSSSLVCVWNRTWGGTSTDYGYSVGLDSIGNIYLAGYTWSFGVGDWDLILVKYDQYGVQQWNRTWGGFSAEYGYGVTVDSLNNVYLVGYTWSFGVGDYDMVLVKYDEDGNQQWNRTWGGFSAEYGYGVTVDSLNNLYLVGYTGSFGVGSRDIVLVKYDENGDQQWNRTWGGTGWDVGRAVTVDSLGNVYLTGYTESFGEGLYDIVLVKYNENGVQQWNHTWGGTDWDLGYGVVVDSSSNVYLTGYTDFFGAGLRDIVLVKYDTNGVQQWNRTWGGTSNEIGYQIMGDSLSNVYLVGKTESFGAGYYDMVLIKYDSNGVQQWNRTWGGSNIDSGQGIALNSSDNIYLAGYTSSFGGGDSDLILVKYSPDIFNPVITINSPSQNEIFGVKPPQFNISIKEPNLNNTWYTIDNGTTNITFNGFTGTINQTEWDKKGNGEVIIIFYANDSLANIDSKSVTVWKDLINPAIKINSPIPNQLCGIIAPTFSLTLDEPHLHKKWYSLNGGQNITFITENQIYQAEWDKYGNGTILIRFGANDTAGNINYTEVLVRKDACEPEITIDSPLSNQTFGLNAPSFNISIDEETSVYCWFTIEGVAGEFPLTELNGTINQEAWDDALDGQITLTFYARDEAGNIGSNYVIVRKQLPEELAIPGCNIIIIIAISWFSVIISVYHIKNKIKYYN